MLLHMVLFLVCRFMSRLGIFLSSSCTGALWYFCSFNISSSEILQQIKSLVREGTFKYTKICSCLIVMFVIYMYFCWFQTYVWYVWWFYIITNSKDFYQNNTYEWHHEKRVLITIIRKRRQSLWIWNVKIASRRLGRFFGIALKTRNAYRSKLL